MASKRSIRARLRRSWHAGFDGTVAVGALVAGQNVWLGSQVVEFGLPTGIEGVAALALNEEGRADSGDGLIFEGRPSSAGITLRDGAMQIDLDALDPSTHRVLCIAYSAGRRPAPFDCVIGDDTFAVSDPFQATVCFEVYQRGVAWKVRAVGQGYAGGLPELLVTYGLASAGPPAIASSAAAVLPLAPSPGRTVEPLQRIWMIYEDAARITAAFLSAREFASSRLDDDLSLVVADPANRNTPAGIAATTAAQKRHDELIARARVDYDRDATYLTNELRDLDDNLPPAMGSWKSSAWRRSPERSHAVRLGALSVAELGPLSIPFCVPAPLRRPIWVDTGVSAAAVPVVTALVLRLLAASPHPTPTLDMIDLAGGLCKVWEPLANRMVRPVVTNHADIAPRLKELAAAADLAEMRLEGGGERPPASVVVFADFGYGLPREALGEMIALVAKWGLGTSLILVGENTWDGVDQGMRELSEYSQHIVLSDGVMFDPWTRNAWTFAPDMVRESDRTLTDLAALQPLERGPI